MMIQVNRPLFGLGKIVATRGAQKALEKADQHPWEFLSRHVAGDWGEVGEEDRQANEEAVKDGARLLSAYSTKAGERLWLITEAENDHGKRVATTILLPDEY